MKILQILVSASVLATVTAPAQITLNPLPTRVIGQNSLTVTNLNPNLVEGREFVNPQGVALDMSSNPPALYVTDTGNNRVLGFRSAVGFSNGRKADVALGQPDLVTTLAGGPGHAGHSAGLTTPTGIAVDSAGNVYVVDSGNNRILRFPRPFTQTGEQIPDLVIGQPGFTSNAPNQGGISAATLGLAATNAAPFQAYITFDAAGNLWAADPGNNRVLRYPVAALGNQAAPGPAADLVLGQSDFITGSYAPVGNSALSLNAIAAPTGIAFDSAGRLFVSESVSGIRSRILMFAPPFATGQRAARLLGVDLNVPQPAPISELQLNQATSGLFAVGSQIGIADTFNNRLLLFPPVEQWDASSTFQAATAVVGQKDFNSGGVNQGQPGAGPATLARPSAAVFSGSELFIADSLNQRVVVMPASGIGGGFNPATRVLGQDALDLNTANLIEGREFNFNGASGIEAGLAVDINSDPPRLYVADTFNNRVLGFRDLRNLQPGQKADIVIGQPDFQHSFANYPSNDVSKPNQAGLTSPTGLYVDAQGNLYVADSGNGRVVRFPRPFENYAPGVTQQADLVLGQIGFFTKITDPSSRTMAAPYGVSLSSTGLLVSDTNHNRVLFFPGTTATLASGEAATKVFGQPDFTSSGSGNGQNRMSSPRHIGVDSDDRLYVADSGNGRVLIFDRTTLIGPDPNAAVALTQGLSSPRGLYISPVNGELWVADANTGTATRFPSFNLLAATNNAPNGSVSALSPRAITEDAWGNAFIADSANRVVIHYPELSALNAANYLGPNALAPGMIAALYSRGNSMQFGTATATSQPPLPLPRQLGGVQVLFNNSPVPIFFVGPDQINFQVPMGAPQSGTANLQVLEVSTGRLLGDSTVGMNPALPGFFTQAANGSGAAVAQNKDGSLNSQTNPAIAGDIITIYGTGQGYIAGAPPDGDVANKPLSTAIPPTVIIGGFPLAPEDVTYAGLSPALVGVWQINARIPKQTITLPNNPTQILAIQSSVPTGGAAVGRGVIIYVKQP